MCIYIYIERERDRDVYIYIYIYIYICIKVRRFAAQDTGGAWRQVCMARRPLSRRIFTFHMGFVLQILARGVNVNVCV